MDISHSIVRPGEDTYFTVTNLDASGEKSMSICQTAAISPYPCLLYTSKGSASCS